MKFDALKQYASLKHQLTNEKSQLESRLNEINQVLGADAAPSQASPKSPIQTEISRPVARRGRKPAAGNSMSLREAVVKALSNGPLARKELAAAVEKAGYVFTTSNPLNSIGSVLYAKNGPVKSRLGKFYVEGAGGGASTGIASEDAPAKKKKRKMSAAGRASISAAAKARWAKKRKSSGAKS